MVNRLVSVGDDFNLPDAVNVVDGNLPDRLQDAALSATYVPRSLTQIGLDNDGAPYFSDALEFSAAVPILTDTDGVPYISA